MMHGNAEKLCMQLSYGVQWALLTVQGVAFACSLTVAIMLLLLASLFFIFLLLFVNLLIYLYIYLGHDVPMPPPSPTRASTVGPCSARAAGTTLGSDYTKA
jgi:hypothetical protein